MSTRGQVWSVNGVRGPLDTGVPLSVQFGSEVLRVTAATDESVLLTVPEAARLLRISRNLAYELIRQGRLPHVRLGRRILVPRFGLEQWIAREAGLPQPPHPVVSLPQRH
ncbi:MAG: helix-turn-helix domain-containing protein [Dehalococcoidia bacterium]|nr:helix-turn-helix domain-containing protein [Dehalococcoidia bacterium]